MSVFSSGRSIIVSFVTALITFSYLSFALVSKTPPPVCVKPILYIQITLLLESSVIWVSISISEFARAARHLILDTPPLDLTASCKPPPLLAISLKNLNTSSKFDLPEAFGPTIKTLSTKSTSTFLKFFQFCNINFEIII